MCTSLCLPTPDGGHLFGRTLDLDAHFGEGVVLTPRRYPLGHGVEHYAILGMATVMDGYPLYADAMNERGLCMAGLRFTGNACYPEKAFLDKKSIAPWELIPYLLGRCADLCEVRAALGEITVVARDFRPDVPAAPLHWHITDRDPASGSLVLEVTREGMRVFDDPAGVLTNNPPFDAQLARFGEYAHLESRSAPPPDGSPTAVAGQALGVSLSSLGEGALGLPGDYSSTSRFVRAAHLRRWCMEVKGGSVAEFFRIMGAVSPTAGAVITDGGGVHRTLYTACMDTRAGTYYGRFEGELAVWSVGFADAELDGEVVIPLSPRR